VTKRRRTLLRRLGERAVLFLIPFFAYALIQFVRRTMRIEEVNTGVLRPFIRGNEEETGIVAFWHSRLLMMPFLRRKRRVTMLISRHRDGELISRAIRLFPVDPVRGSTTRGGARALRELARAIKKGSHVVITPDGPRGPRNVAQAGAIMLASRTGRPIFPVTFSASRKKIFNSWDRFLFPSPFSRGVFVWGEPIWVGPEEDQASMEEKRRTLQERLNEITAQADHHFDR
jgi:lysophospholipid acyltransferase (LPLAT)-like uncharacterized protein